MPLSISCWARQGALLGVLTLSALSPVRAEPGDRKRLGQPGEWKNTVAVAVLKNNLYSIESDGTLYSTNLSNGQWKPVGQGRFPATKFLCAAAGNLYAAQSNGTLYRVNPTTGAKQRLGAPGVWKNVIQATGFNGALYSVTAKGGLYRTDLATGKWKKVGKDEFGGTILMVNREKATYAAPGLFTIEGDGSLYEVNGTNGTWKNVGAAAQWKASKAGAIISEADTLYVVNDKGVLQWTIISAEGARPIPMGQPIHKGTRFLFVGHGGPMPTLYSLTADGSLYAIEMAPMVG